MITKDRSILKQVSKDTTIEECKNLNVFEKLKTELKESSIPGLGLAAIQISIPIKAVFMFYRPNKDAIYDLQMINPRIIQTSQPIIFNGEGCLSVDGNYDTDRFDKCTIEWLDYNTGETLKADFNGLFSVACQHEIDHTNGILLDQRQHQIVKLGRNSPCYCGSGKKYKNCHLI